jgi:flagellar basal body rod protein FlgC
MVAAHSASAMSIAIYNAMSGIRAATVRLEASARRVAAATGVQSPSAGAPVYILTPASQARPVEPVGPTAGVRNTAPVWMAAYQNDADGAAGASVDLAAEALEQASARSLFLANAKTLQVTQDMVKRLFELDS